MPVESPFSIPFPQILGVCVCGRLGIRVDVQARVVYVLWVSECVCLLYPSIFIFYSSFCFG